MLYSTCINITYSDGNHDNHGTDDNSFDNKAITKTTYNYVCLINVTVQFFFIAVPNII